MIELLAPAGDIEKLQTAYYFGADACYFAGKKYGLRAFSDNFENKQLEESIKFAHSIGKKAYITINIIAHNNDFIGLDEYILFLEKAGVDAVIIADLGVIALVRKIAPNLSIHVSTQANVTNSNTAKFYADLGVSRIILARELTLQEIREIRAAVPPNIELEAFVHGAMCISYSGRCLLSNFLTGRDSNRGACVQACRWEYVITEKKAYDKDNDTSGCSIMEDERGAYILNSKDLCLIEHIDQLIEAGITSLKIEGRMKSSYYVANVTNAYRRAINFYYECKLKNIPYKCPKNLLIEVEKSSHRKYTTGFLLGEAHKEYTESSLSVQTHEIMARVINSTQNGYVKIEQRNRFKVGDVLEILSPGQSFNEKVTVTDILDENNEKIFDALNVKQIMFLRCDKKLQKNDILRKKVQ